MKRKITVILTIALFLAGLSLLLYPLAANQWNTYRQNQLISDYDNIIKEKESAGEIDYEAAWQQAQSYNSALLPSILPDSFADAEEAETEDDRYMSCLNLTGD